MGVTSYLSLGSNVGDRFENLRMACKMIDERCGKIHDIANTYENEAVGFTSETLFLNTCLKLETDLKPSELLHEIHEIEMALGRNRNPSECTYSSRTIDVDIVLFGTEIHQTDTLHIPHPRYLERKFVLLPLLDLDADLIDPKTNKRLHLYLEEIVDESIIYNYKKRIFVNEL